MIFLWLLQQLRSAGSSSLWQLAWISKKMIDLEGVAPNMVLLTSGKKSAEGETNSGQGNYWAGLLHRPRHWKRMSPVSLTVTRWASQAQCWERVNNPIPGNGEPSIPVGANARLVASRQSPARSGRGFAPGKVAVRANG